MTMSGTCECGRFLWYTSVESVLSIATREGRKTYKEFKKYINESRPDGLLVCPNCGKRYSEEEFMELNDCVGYDIHGGCTRDPKLAYQQAIARFYDSRYRSEAMLSDDLKQNIKDMIKVCGIGFIILVIYLNLLMRGY